VISSALTGLHDLGIEVAGLQVSSHNTIPHGCGLGSSSAAIVAGLAAAAALAGHDPDAGWLLDRAARIEGHPDNVAAAVLGGFVIAYAQESEVRAVRARLSADLAGVVCIPAARVATRAARNLLPATVAHADAAANAGRAALLVHAMGADLDLLYAATEDRLHQAYRAPVMPESHRLLIRLRSAGHAAVISGAGPTVLVLGRAADLDLFEGAEPPGFTLRAVRPGPGVRVLP
jgi:homoserine kinase